MLIFLSLLLFDSLYLIVNEQLLLEFLLIQIVNVIGKIFVLLVLGVIFQCNILIVLLIGKFFVVLVIWIVFVLLNRFLLIFGCVWNWVLCEGVVLRLSLSLVSDGFDMCNVKLLLMENELRVLFLDSLVVMVLLMVMWIVFWFRDVDIWEVVVGFGVEGVVIGIRGVLFIGFSLVFICLNIFVVLDFLFSCIFLFLGVLNLILLVFVY